MKKLEFDKTFVWDNKVEPTSALNLYRSNTNAEGYFSNYEDFSTYYKYTLTGILVNKNKVNYVGDCINNYPYFILADKAEEVEEKEKYRPYRTVEELPFKLGDVIHYRYKEYKNREYRCLMNEFYFFDGKLCSIHLGTIPLELDNLFKNYEYYDFDSKEWLPFGVKK